MVLVYMLTHSGGPAVTILLIWLCTSAAMDDCQVHPLSKPVPAQQCEVMARVYDETLKRDENYRLVCEAVE